MTVQKTDDLQRLHGWRLFGPEAELVLVDLRGLENLKRTTC